MRGVPAKRLRVLLSEAPSLTAREHLTVLGAAGVRVEAMSSDPFAPVSLEPLDLAPSPVPCPRHRPGWLPASGE